MSELRDCEESARGRIVKFWNEPGFGKSFAELPIGIGICGIRALMELAGRIWC